MKRYTAKGLALKMVAVPAFLAVAWWALMGTDVRDVTREPNGALAHKQSTNALVGGCGPIYTYPDEVAQQMSGTVPPTDRMGKPNRQQYQTTVPIFGRFWNSPAVSGQRFWALNDKDVPMPEQLLRNQWDGAVVVYYTDEVSTAEIRTLRDVVEVRPELDVLVVPWDAQVRGPLPRGREVAFAAWNSTQTCHQFVAPALYDFRRDHPAHDAPGSNGADPQVLSTTKPLSVPIAQ